MTRPYAIPTRPAPTQSEPCTWELPTGVLCSATGDRHDGSEIVHPYSPWGARPLSAAAWTQLAIDLMPLIEGVIEATQRCERQIHLTPKHVHVSEDGEWSCSLIDGPVNALLTWAEGTL